MSPEYAMKGIVSMKVDVFSFGVLLLEIISGKKNNSFHHSGQQMSLIGYVSKFLSNCILFIVMFFYSLQQ